MFQRAFALVGAAAAVLALSVPADAAPVGKFSLKSKEVQEVSGAWHVYVTIELPKPPLTAHQSMRFLFTKNVVYERSLVDGKTEPVLNRMVLKDQSPSTESLDVDFADPSGKIYKATRFDFGLARVRGYEAGEYKVELRTSDGFTIGTSTDLILKGDNPPVDRRAMVMGGGGKDGKIKKIEGYDGGSNQAKNEDGPVAANNNGPAEVTPMGTATGFVPAEGMKETEEEKIKTRPAGCGCEVIGSRSGGPLSAAFSLLPLLGLGVAAARRRARSRTVASSQTSARGT